MLRGHKGPRRSARPMLSLHGFRMGGVMEGYMLWAVATSAGAPIVYGRFRPRSGELPTGTSRFLATRLLRAQRQSNFCCSDMGLGSWRYPPAPAWGRPKHLRQEACMDSTVLWRTPQWPTR